MPGDGISWLRRKSWAHARTELSNRTEDIRARNKTEYETLWECIEIIQTLNIPSATKQRKLLPFFRDSCFELMIDLIECYYSATLIKSADFYVEWTWNASVLESLSLGEKIFRGWRWFWADGNEIQSFKQSLGKCNLFRVGIRRNKVVRTESLERIAFDQSFGNFLDTPRNGQVISW